jgi:acyl-CoA synthetase (AMP-forming)/AMP-acid ligase II
MLIDLVRSSAARDPARPVVVTTERSTTVGELLQRAETVAARLAELAPRRLACLIDDTADLLAVLCGAAEAGVEICICPTDRDQATIDALLVALGKPAVATDGARQLGSAAILPVAELVAATQTVAPPAAADDPGLLVLTTGTTGAPKPTRQRWSRLLGGVVETTPGAVWLLTYNVSQFAGLQMLLHTLVNDATIVVPVTRQPIDAAEAINRHHVTHVSATPTFWRLLLVNAAAGGPPLPLEQITLGGEVVPGELLDRLHDAFPSARITHVYAGTEFGSTIAVSDRRPGLPAALLERTDQSRPQVRVVDGELQVRSTVGMVGYLGESDLDSEWIPTGDLVERTADRLVFTGRINERINVGGTKVSPHLIEAVVHAVPGVAMAAAYGRPNPITGAIVAVDVVPVEGVDTDALKTAIGAACQSLPPAFRPRLVKFVAELAQRGGKVTRPGSSDETLSK